MKQSIAPLPLSREEIITEGGIPAEIFDYVDKALEDPLTLQRATGISYWFPCTWEAAREIRIDKNRSLFFLMQGPGKSAKRGYIRVVDTGIQNAWKKSVFRGPLTLKGAQSAIAKVSDLAW